MKTRMSLIFATLLVILMSMIWVVRDPGRANDAAVPPSMAAPTVTAVPPLNIAVKPPEVVPAAPVASAMAVPQAPAVLRTQVHIDKDGITNYTARDGDTVSELATALLGSDSKAHRDAVIAANPSLQNNPDRVLAGDNYVYDSTPQPAQPAAAPMPASSGAVAVGTVAAPAAASVDSASDQKGNSQRQLSYTAQPGDNVAVLAASLLGGDTKENRDAVISGNASLVRDPDRLVAGKTYTITTTSGLVASAQPRPELTPTTQPDADDAARMSVGRVLSYVALPGDTLSKLATVLLGSDTEANRQAIMNNNRSLQLDPDHLVAGKTYWIAAP